MGEWRTDGKWDEERGCVPIFSEFDFPVAGAFYVGGTQTANANARLIAQAPELYALAKNTKDYICQYVCSTLPDHHALCKQAEAALRAVEGE